MVLQQIAMHIPCKTMKDNILEKIIQHKSAELVELKKKYKNISNKIDTSIPSKFKTNFTNQEHVKIIAEIKPASPSEGMIFEPTKKNIKNIAKVYSQYPIAAISVLTDEKYFHGSYENIAMVKDVTSIPVLCKEFIIDEFQINLAKYFRADAVLLIAEALSEEKSIALYSYAKELNLDVLFEFHFPEKLNFLLENDIDIIGINNRDLNTLKLNIQKCLNLRNQIPDNKILIAESGFDTPDQLRLLEECKFNGALIGTSLLKSDDINKKLKGLVYYYE